MWLRIVWLRIVFHSQLDSVLLKCDHDQIEVRQRAQAWWL
jgi:hypothetical protein